MTPAGMGKVKIRLAGLDMTHAEALQDLKDGRALRRLREALLPAWSLDITYEGGRYWLEVGEGVAEGDGDTIAAAADKRR